MQATFFVETVQRHYFRDDPMRAQAARIAEDGHELQLHVHPCWAVFQHADWPQRVGCNHARTIWPAASWLPRWPAAGTATFAEWGLPHRRCSAQELAA
jgi:hypothetical protein